ncbi:MAG: DEAD/DEAH box helicase family protein [Bacteroidales bacterium]|nr:DEAD/DEAH box helicase family protein [Bacteroidales bacterium]MDY5194548.1 DEAD/DEAH box helicase family protein [Candidatus Aphodosoma sp.]
MTPEEKARIKIDQMFEDAGWKVVDRDFYSPTLTAVAIREGLLEGNKEADYFLFINGIAVGILEAKRKEVDVASNNVSEQAAIYVRGVPNYYKAYSRPLPIIYQSNGEKTFFRDFRNKDGDLIELNRIYTPKEIVKMLGIKDFYAGLPTLKTKGLRDCQYEAITELENSFRVGQNKALIVLATGAGKTYTACLAAYRLLAYTPMKRILFLVDRNNLGKQAEGEFGMFRLTENGDPFNTIFTVNRIKSAKIPSDSNVVISTIQRLFSLLTGQEIVDNDDDENTIIGEVQLTENMVLPPDFFDLIIIDECHRSIYGNWKKVLEYFNTAKLIGLTATPVPETKAFFNNNIVVNYTLEQSIIDGVNVDARIYRIKTEATENGGAILKGDKVKRETRYTGKIEMVRNEETKNYTKEELNRSIINPAQIKLVLKTYRDAVYTEMFTDPKREPNMDYLPKTLIFALNEVHANNIVHIAKEVFGRADDKFVQKITYSSGDSNELIRQFRNDKEFRIAVTCTLVATGTDVKPLEVLIFMRDVASEPLYIQMKGRGVRTIGDEQLRNVTPNAFSKDFFFLVDAVGITESPKTTASPSDSEPVQTITLKRLLELLTHGNVNDDYLRLIAARLARINHKCTDKQREEFRKLAYIGMQEISAVIFDALEKNELPPYVSIDEPNLERKALVAPLTHHPEARQYLLILAAGFIETLMPGEDNLISKGFSEEEAKDVTSSFEKYCDEHKDEIEALRIIYNNDGEPLTYTMLRDLENKLKLANNKFNTSRLWNCYTIVNPQSVKKHSTKEEKEALTNIIQLVRFANHQIETLESLYPSAQQRFNLWYGQVQRTVTESQITIIRQIVDYIASNGACTIKDIIDDDKTRAAQLINAFGGKTLADEALASLSKFLLYRKTA